MNGGKFIHIAVDVQNRFLFPEGATAHSQSAHGGEDFLNRLLDFDRTLRSLDVHTVWIASRDKRTKADSQPPNRDMPEAQRRQFLARHDFPAAVVKNFSGMVSLKTDDSAFSNPGLLKRLRQLNVRTLLISGLYAGQCVRATTEDAAAMGFTCRILADLTLDRRQGDTPAARRQRLIENFSGNPLVEIVSSGDFLGGLRGSSEQSASAFNRNSYKRRVLLNYFRQESRYSGAMMPNRERLAFSATITKALAASKGLMRSFHTIQDELV